MSAPEPSSSGVFQDMNYKNRLQEYTQKASMALPLYETNIEGAQHPLHFKSQVWVEGVCFVSPNSFPNKKMAEQDAAKHALALIHEKVKNECHSRILEDAVFCKLIVNEYAVKMNMSQPLYITNRTDAVIPMFVSSFELNGVTYTGQAGKNKKEAEQLAARSAILSFLGSESGTTMSEIVKSKFKMYDAMKKVKDSSNTIQGGDAPGATNLEQDSGALLSANEKNDGITGSPTAPVQIPQSSSLVSFGSVETMVPEYSVEGASNTQAVHDHVHVFKKPKVQASPSAITPEFEAVPPASFATVVPCIEFVPPVSEQAPACSTSGKKQRRKNRKGKNKVQNQSPLVAAMIPRSSAPAFPVAQ